MEAWEARNADPRTWEIIDAVDAVSSETGASASQVSLAWLSDRPAVTSVILGARTVEQLEDNLGAADLELTDEQRARLDEASTPRTDIYPYGEQAIQQRHRKREGGR